MSLNTQSRAADQDGGRVFDVADPDRRGKVISAGPQQSEVRFDDGVSRVVSNVHLRPVEPIEADELAGPTHTSEPEATAVQDGQQAWVRLRHNSTWNDWKAVGAAHVVGRTEAMRDAHTNKPEGRGYCAAFSAWARKYGFDLDKGDRARLFNVMDHLVEIESWLAKLTPTERLRFNHPNTIWRRWKAATVEPKAGAEKKASPIQKLNDEIIKLQEENDRMRREIEDGGGDLWNSDDRPRDIARIVIQQCKSKTKAENVAREILKALKVEKQKS
jgi:hypothetical protein